MPKEISPSQRTAVKRGKAASKSQKQASAPKPRQRRKAARPAEILTAALDLWGEQGFAATRLEDVAAQAGIAKGTIYLYYPSKQALFEAAVKESLTRVVQEQRVLAELSAEPSLVLLEKFIQAIGNQMIEGRAAILLKILVAEGKRFPELVELYREVAIARGLGLVKAILARANERGELQDGAETLDLRLVVAPIMAMAIWHLVFAPITATERQKLRQQHLEILRRALFKPEIKLL